MTKERKLYIFKRLREIDKELQKIYQERDALKKECQNKDCYMEIFDEYFGDGEHHLHW